jgi:methionyl aminopeptidase
MIYYKTERDIAQIQVSGDLLGRTHAEVAKQVKPGVTTQELDKIAETFIKDHGAMPSFLKYKGFPASLCISVNDVVVHGIPGKYVLKEGDIVSIDCGVFLNGFHADSAYTYPVGEVSAEVKKLLEVTKGCLTKGIEQVRSGNRIGDIGFAVQTHAERSGFSVVRELVGHGLGRNLHEKPDVPNFGKRGQGQKIENGLVIAIEPMINLGSKTIFQERDGWTIRAKDRKPSAHFEHTVAFIAGEARVLTTFKYIEEVFTNQYA